MQACHVSFEKGECRLDMTFNALMSQTSATKHAPVIIAAGKQSLASELLMTL